jgi:shikimate dehydrogenase
MRSAGVVGWPVAHSRSPMIHGHWLRLHGIEGSYDRIAVRPEDADAFFATFPASGLCGCNVTLPHKEIAASHARHLEPVAARLGAANTLWLENGELCATNTDVAGFLGNLDASVPGWDANPGVALVLGAGGAAKAVVDGLVYRGFSVEIANRTLSRAEALAARYPDRASARLLSEANRLVPTASLIVNTTSVGMKGEGELDLDLHRAGSESIAADIVYVPLITPFLARAHAAGLRTVDGLGMLLHQAVPGFEKWFGVRPEVTPELRAIVEADL